MSDEIKITIEVNGQPGTLADVSLETLTGMRNKAWPTAKVKPIEHGDYGYAHNIPEDYRLFIRINGELKAYDKDAIECGNVYQSNFDYSRQSCYTYLGNIFKDLQNG